MVVHRSLTVVEKGSVRTPHGGTSSCSARPAPGKSFASPV
ncbi:hypothetical protein FM106_07870 [Brachybacterium faecium]|nr:hypothetical protein FM106_07870 [Brachybacterium faecium]